MRTVIKHILTFRKHLLREPGRTRRRGIEGEAPVIKFGAQAAELERLDSGAYEPSNMRFDIGAAGFRRLTDPGGRLRGAIA